jgi:hypothetical protein
MRALKNKSGLEIANALKDIFKGERKPELVWCDKGKEFYIQHVKSLVTVYSTENEEKSCVIDYWLYNSHFNMRFSPLSLQPWLSFSCYIPSLLFLLLIHSSSCMLWIFPRRLTVCVIAR